MPSRARFQLELREQIGRAIQRGARHIVMNSAQLHRAVGGYPGPDQQLQFCCDVMREEMKPGDSVMGNPKNYQAASLTIHYVLPHAVVSAVGASVIDAAQHEPQRASA